MYQEEYLKCVYNFVLADSNSNPKYTKGNIIEGKLVLGTIEEIKNLCEKIFSVPVTFSDNVFTYAGCVIKILSDIDYGVPYNPKSLGKIEVSGDMERIGKVDFLLVQNIPEIENNIEIIEE